MEEKKAEGTIEVNLYALNQQLISGLDPLTENELNNEISEIASWFSSRKVMYYMLLCHERRDYTLFHFNDYSKECYKGSQEVFETLLNRGTIMSIQYEQNNEAFSIWIKNEEEGVNVYYLFPYDAGVVEI